MESGGGSAGESRRVGSASNVTTGRLPLGAAGPFFFLRALEPRSIVKKNRGAEKSDTGPCSKSERIFGKIFRFIVEKTHFPLARRLLIRVPG